MKKLKMTCAVIGLIHAIAMVAFALGSELSPLMVLIVDAPVAHFTKELSSPILQFGIPIAVCSVVYPLVIYLVGLLFIRPTFQTPIQPSQPTPLKRRG